MMNTPSQGDTNGNAHYFQLSQPSATSQTGDLPFQMPIKPFPALLALGLHSLSARRTLAVGFEVGPRSAMRQYSTVFLAAGSPLYAPPPPYASVANG